MYTFSKRGRIANRNLRAAFAHEKPDAELRRIARQSVQNLAMGIVEILKFPDHDKRYLETHVSMVDPEKFQPYLKSGTGIIFLTAHFGNWEQLNLVGRLLDLRVAVLVRSQKHPRSDAYLNSIRAHHGTQVIAKGMPIREIIRALRRGWVVGMLSDQDGGANGVFVDFFGRKSSCPSGVAAFAIRTNTPIFPVFAFRDPKDPMKHRIEIEGPILAQENLSEEDNKRYLLQAFSDLLEIKIRKAPDQWLWVHRRWKSTPDRFVTVLTDGKAGHVQQSMAIVEALKEERRAKGCTDQNFHLTIVEVLYKNKWARALHYGLGLLSGGIFFGSTGILKACLKPASFAALSASYADIVVSCGSSLVLSNIYLKHLNSAKSICLMRPPTFVSADFDAIILPRHDKIPSEANLYRVHLAPSPDLFHNRSASASAEFAQDAKWLGCLIGGDSKSLLYDRPKLERWLTDLETFAKEAQLQLAVTTSRRTPAWADQVISDRLKGNPLCDYLVIANVANRADAVQEIMKKSAVIAVSGDSISMVSESVRSGKPVVVFHPYDKLKLRYKFTHFYNQLKSDQCAYLVDGDALAALRQAYASRQGAGAQVIHQDRQALLDASRRILA